MPDLAYSTDRGGGGGSFETPSVAVLPLYQSPLFLCMGIQRYMKLADQPSLTFHSFRAQYVFSHGEVISGPGQQLVMQHLVVVGHIRNSTCGTEANHILSQPIPHSLNSISLFFNGSIMMQYESPPFQCSHHCSKLMSNSPSFAVWGHGVALHWKGILYD